MAEEDAAAAAVGLLHASELTHEPAAAGSDLSADLVFSERTARWGAKRARLITCLLCADPSAEVMFFYVFFFFSKYEFLI